MNWMWICLDLMLCLCKERQVFVIVVKCKAMHQNDIHASVAEDIHRSRTGTCCKCWRKRKIKFFKQMLEELRVKCRSDIFMMKRHWYDVKLSLIASNTWTHKRQQKSTKDNKRQQKSTKVRKSQQKSMYFSLLFFTLLYFYVNIRPLLNLHRSHV